MADKEKEQFYEVMRLINLIRSGKNSTGDLLHDALNGLEPTVETVSKMFNFYVTHLGSGYLWRQGIPCGQDIITPMWDVCRQYFQEAGLSDEEIEDIKHPQPFGYKNILDELGEKI
jgi:hypothetical protein